MLCRTFLMNIPYRQPAGRYRAAVVTTALLYSPLATDGSSSVCGVGGSGGGARSGGPWKSTPVLRCKKRWDSNAAGETGATTTHLQDMLSGPGAAPPHMDPDLLTDDEIGWDDGRPRAAITFGTFPQHVTAALQKEAARKGYKSRYWITVAQAKKRNVAIREGEKGFSIPGDVNGINEYHVVNIDCVEPEQLAYFFEDNPAPNDAVSNPQKPYAFYNEKWRLVSDPIATTKLNDLKLKQDYGYNWWMDTDEADSFGFNLLPPREGEEAVDPVCVTEGSMMVLFNAEQAERPKMLIPPPSAIERVRMNE